MTATWYVTYEIRKRGLLPRERSPRITRAFAAEDDAKQFARAKLEEGLVVFAGTINPHSPRQLILSESVTSWLGDDQSTTRNHSRPARE
ncbi:MULTISPECIES: hypothetical protein [Bradyrhizobium]|uniref:hypothetical protein n=1 Tax=Bradyrhizobium TaxID=374 RepID=UPI00067F543E|nr:MULTISPECIES: hypothetical protein [Bradyrhizobium]PAY07978.1 hypothetical protein CK489_20120 [Bradyrhizobium sp. UFLA03-84]